MEKKPIKFKDKIEYLTLEEVCTRFEGLVYGLCKRWTIRYDIEDLKQIGFIGLVNAYRSYDITKDVLFTTYASMVVNSTLIKNYRSDKSQHILFTSLNTPINSESDRETELIELFDDDVNYEDLALNNVECEELKAAIDKLDSMDRSIVEMIAFGYKTQRQVAEILNTNQVSISRMYKKALEKIKKIMRGEYNMPIKSDLTKGELLNHIKKYGSNKESLMIMANKYDLTLGTIRGRLDTWDIRKYSKDYRGTKKVDMDKNTTAQNSKMEAPSFLQEIKTYKGSIGQYRIDGDNVDLQFGNTTVSIQKENIMNLVLELSELNRIIS